MGFGNSVTIGHKYFMDVAGVFALGGVEELRRIWMNDKLVFKGSITENTRIFIDKEDIFGGETGNGGVRGYAEIRFGKADQEPSNYEQSLNPDKILSGDRGVFSIEFQNFYWGNSPVIPQIAIEVKTTSIKDDFTPSWYPEKSAIVSVPAERLDINIVHFLRDVLVGVNFGRYDESDLDDASWIAAADYAFENNLGISAVYNSKSDDYKNVISELLGVLGATIIPNADGKLEIKPLTDDYDINIIFHANPSNITSFGKYQVGNGGELKNGLNVSFTHAQYTKEEGDKDFGEDIVYAEDVSFVTATATSSITDKGNILSINRGLLTNPDTAFKHGTSELAKANSGAITMDLTVNLSGQLILPGDVFRFTYKEPLEDVDKVFRVFNVDYGNGRNNEVKLEGCVEDIFKILDPTTSTSPNTGWVDPNNAARDIINKIITEVPYYVLASEASGLVDLSTIDDITDYIWAVAQKPSQDSINFRFAELPDGTDNSAQELNNIDFPTTARIKNDIGITESVLELINFSEISTLIPGNYAVLDNEIISIKEVNFDMGTITVDRAILDTTPQKHTRNAIIYFVGGLGTIASNPYFFNENVRLKLLTRTPSNSLPLNDASLLSRVIIQRQARPYAPGKIRINDMSRNSNFEIVINFSDNIHITWAGRNRLTQTTNEFITQDHDNIIPEVGTSYNIIIKLPDSTILREFNDITVNEIMYLKSDEAEDSFNLGLIEGFNPQLDIEIKSKRNDLDSYQSQLITLKRNPRIVDNENTYTDNIIFTNDVSAEQI